MEGNERFLAEDGVNFCYTDESGTGRESIATMVGIVVDSQRMHLTKRHWRELLDILTQSTKRPIAELHTADFYSGNGVWRDIDGPTRASVITAVLDWLVDRKHHVVYTSVLKSSYSAALSEGAMPSETNTPWRFLGFHLTLAIQKYSQHEKGTKGHTVLVFDNEEREKVRFSDVVLNPPEWSDEYYSRGSKQQQLDQIVDVPYFGDSKELPLIQVADFFAFLLRRYAEIQENLVPPRYTDEAERVTGWVNHLKDRSIGSAHIYPRRQRNEAQDLFYRYAAPSIRDL